VAELSGKLEALYDSFIHKKNEEKLLYWMLN